MDWIISDELDIKVSHVVGWAAATAMVVGGVIPYVPQYIEIKKTQDAEGFSLYVCLALLVANSLRILFWFSSRYELPLLVQSVVMNVTMFLMIHLCVKVKRMNANTRDHALRGDELQLPKVLTDTDTGASVSTDATVLKRARSRHYLNDLDLKYFWNWTDFQSYLDMMLVVWAVGAAITYLMLSVHWFMEAMGFVAVFTEAMLGAPQFLRNFKNKSTYGMSIHMVIMWTLGDMFKTGYFIARNAPSQFWICGTLQASIPKTHHQQQQQNHEENQHQLHTSHSEERQLSQPITLSSSGDDHLLTARADDEHYKSLDFGQCHDNRAFQYHHHNNNNNSSKLLPRPGGSGKSQSRHDSSGNPTAAVAVALDALEVVIVHKPQPLANGSGKAGNRNHSSSCCHRRHKRHNATQTSIERCCCISSCHCHHVTTTHHHHHHCHHHHCQHEHYERRHQQLELPEQKLHARQRGRQKQQQQQHKRQQPQHHHNTKSSLDTSEERPQLHSAAIAIEIDAATVTENNSSTATSNFPYKVASEGGGAPINLIPLCEQHRQRRRGSLNSNTTIETDELSPDDDEDDDDEEDDDDVRLGLQPDDEEQLTPRSHRNSSNSSSTGRALAGAAPTPRNECVRIKRKRFEPDAMHDYCSSCSRCSSCSCDHDARTSSCSSLDDELQLVAGNHELTVAADCHCRETGNSSPKSFCSCHTDNCCCGSEAGDDADADGDGDDETTGARDSFCTAADHTIVSTPTLDEAHSSTLTPLSTQEHTMRSEIADEDSITDADASSLSQSAEYFSLSSTTGAAATTAAAAAPSTGAAEPQCSSSGSSSKCNTKHWSKHIPIDVNALLQQTIRKTAVLQETPLRQPRKHLRPATTMLPAGAPGSNDSSTATLTPSVVTVAKQPLTHTAVTSHNGVTNVTTTLPATVKSGRRSGKFAPVGGCDPLQRRSTEIIL
ncbi:hypothetical protein KR093_008445 [Drosophila rubida]|uniref:Solute carrier family 66 member 2 n=1 Tax=Drosophila rubida TaxID=30044 RepID=A0AAD4K8C0_9MUSC|nr:hypothetical protein KR093_008445 [Drosophila rubida]